MPVGVERDSALKDLAERQLREQEEAKLLKALPIEEQLPNLEAFAASVFAKRSLAIIGYGTCSATLLVINKLAVSQVPAPSFILVCQLVSSVVTVRALGAAGGAGATPPPVGPSHCPGVVEAAGTAASACWGGQQVLRLRGRGLQVAACLELPQAPPPWRPG